MGFEKYIMPFICQYLSNTVRNFIILKIPFHLPCPPPQPQPRSNHWSVRHLFFKKDFIYFFLEIEEGREKERERNISVWLPLMRPLLGTWPATQACALTGNRTSDPLVHRRALNPLSHTSQGGLPSLYFCLFMEPCGMRLLRLAAFAAQYEGKWKHLQVTSRCVCDQRSSHAFLWAWMRHIHRASFSKQWYQEVNKNKT